MDFVGEWLGSFMYELDLGGGNWGGYDSERICPGWLFRSQ